MVAPSTKYRYEPHIQFGTYLNSIDKTRKRMENLIQLLSDTRKKNKELYKDNVNLEKQLLRLLSWPEVQNKIKDLKDEEDAFIKKCMEEFNIREEKEAQE